MYYQHNYVLIIYTYTYILLLWMGICNWLGFVILKNVVIDHYHYFCSSGYDIFRFAAMFSSVQLLSHVRLLVAPWTTARQASLSITNSWSSPKPMSIKPVMPSNHLILCRPFLLLPSIFPSIRVFSNKSALHIKWPKYWSFSFNISPSNEHPGLISFRIDWLDPLAVQGTLKSLLQHHSSKASILWRSAFFIVQLPQPWRTPFPVWNWSVVPCPVLTVASRPAYRFLKRQVWWSGIPISWRNFPQFIVIHTVKGLQTC